MDLVAIYERLIEKQRTELADRLDRLTETVSNVKIIRKVKNDARARQVIKEEGMEDLIRAYQQECNTNVCEDR